MIPCEDSACPPPKPDVKLGNHGSVWTVCPITVEAGDWLRANVQDDAQWLGPSLVVETRFIVPLYQGLLAAGFVVQ